MVLGQEGDLVARPQTPGVEELGQAGRALLERPIGATSPERPMITAGLAGVMAAKVPGYISDLQELGEATDGLGPPFREVFARPGSRCGAVLFEDVVGDGGLVHLGRPVGDPEGHRASNILASGISLETPRAPWRCMVRSTASRKTSGSPP